MHIPKDFEIRYRAILSEEYEDFISVVGKSNPSIRVNTIKISRTKLVHRLRKQGFRLKQVPWFKDGYFVLSKEKKVTKTLEYFLGYCYAQDASSMVPPLFLEPKPDDRILDMCATPGSKTTQLAQMMKNKGLILSLDDSLERLKALRINLQRLGVKNVVVVWMDARRFWRTGIKFSKILLDVPCSATGAVLDTISPITSWSLRKVLRLTRIQKGLISSAIKSLDKDGVLVYSTCSLDPDENEAVIDYAVKKFNVEVEEFEIKGLRYKSGMVKWLGKKFDNQIENAIRIYPHHNMTEGFFICKLRR